MKQTFVGLDALRGSAAFVVLAYHTCAYGKTGVDLHGAVAVDLFFMLSGFVVAHAYEARLLNRKLGLAAFSILRLQRLWPLAMLGSVIGAVFLTLINGFMPAVFTVLLNLSMLMIPQPFFHGPMFPTNPVLWSLFVELVLNFAYAALIRHATTGRLAILAAVSLGVLIQTTFASGGLNGVRSDQIVQALARGGASFPVGIILYRLRRHALLSGVALVGRRMGALGVSGVFIAAVTIPVFAHGIDYRYDLGLLAVLAPFLVMAASGVVSTDAGSKTWIFLGALSYPLYALHAPFLDYAGHWAQPALPSLLAALVSLPIAYAGWRWFDAPVQQALKSWRLRKDGLKVDPPGVTP